MTVTNVVYKDILPLSWDENQIIDILIKARMSVFSFFFLIINEIFFYTVIMSVLNQYKAHCAHWESVWVDVTHFVFCEASQFSDSHNAASQITGHYMHC